MTHDFDVLPVQLSVVSPLLNLEATCIPGGSSSLTSYSQMRHFLTESLL